MSNLTLGPILEAHLPTLFKWVNDKEIIDNSNNYKPVHELMHETWYANLAKDKSRFVFSINLDNVLIGTCQLYNVDMINSNAEIQIRIGDTEKRGRGYGGLALKELLNFAFNSLNIHKVYLFVFHINDSAIHLYKKNGFCTDGILRQHSFINGKYLDLICMSLLYKEWLNE
jgi:UDP-4-amino-4,6-dideoxy-N-acetyl-beta-L-altrosamine N-acetyltransferase